MDADGPEAIEMGETSNDHDEAVYQNNGEHESVYQNTGNGDRPLSNAAISLGAELDDVDISSQ